MNHKRYFSIGEVSKLKNVTIKALRYYHQIGLLLPAYINPENGYRYYTIDQFLYLDIIKVCQQSKVTVKEIKTLFDKADTNYLKRYLAQKNEEVLNEIKYLEQLHKRIEILRNAIYSSEDKLNHNGFQMQIFEQRYLLSLPTSGGELNEIQSFDQLDEKLGESVIQTFQYGLIYTCPSLGWEPSDVFRLLTYDDYKVLKDKFNVSILPKGDYITVNCTRENEAQTIQFVQEYIKKNKIRVEKVYMLYLVTDVLNPYNHYSQFQIHVKSTS